MSLCLKLYPNRPAPDRFTFTNLDAITGKVIITALKDSVEVESIHLGLEGRLYTYQKTKISELNGKGKYTNLNEESHDIIPFNKTPLFVSSLGNKLILNRDEEFEMDFTDLRIPINSACCSSTTSQRKTYSEHTDDFIMEKLSNHEHFVSKLPPSCFHRDEKSGTGFGTTYQIKLIVKTTDNKVYKSRKTVIYTPFKSLADIKGDQDWVSKSRELAAYKSLATTNPSPAAIKNFLLRSLKPTGQQFDLLDLPIKIQVSTPLRYLSPTVSPNFHVSVISKYSSERYHSLSDSSFGQITLKSFEIDLITHTQYKLGKVFKELKHTTSLLNPTQSKHQPYTIDLTNLQPNPNSTKYPYQHPLPLNLFSLVRIPYSIRPTHTTCTITTKHTLHFRFRFQTACSSYNLNFETKEIEIVSGIEPDLSTRADIEQKLYEAAMEEARQSPVYFDEEERLREYGEDPPSYQETVKSCNGPIASISWLGAGDGVSDETYQIGYSERLPSFNECLAGL